MFIYIYFQGIIIAWYFQRDLNKEIRLNLCNTFSNLIYNNSIRLATLNRVKLGRTVTIKELSS